MLFYLNEETAAYIEQNGGVIVIDLKFQYCTGDSALTDRRLLGSYIPIIRLGQPDDKSGPYNRTWLRGIMLYYALGIKPKTGLTVIRIALKSLFLYRWLELEGAKLTPIFDN